MSSVPIKMSREMCMKYFSNQYQVLCVDSEAAIEKERNHEFINLAASAEIEGRETTCAREAST